MGLDERAQNAAEQVSGEIKEEVGTVADDGRLEDTGRTEQAEGNIKQAVEKLKDAFRS